MKEQPVAADDSSLEQIQGDVWGDPPSGATDLITTVHRLRFKVRSVSSRSARPETPAAGRRIRAVHRRDPQQAPLVGEVQRQRTQKSSGCASTSAADCSM